MLRLFIMRHAKSDWSAVASDFERPLKKRGTRSAEKMGLWLAQQDIIPGLILTSPALRAEQTARIVCKQLGMVPGEIIRDERIYEGNLDELLTVVSDYGRKKKHMLLTGHNPGMDDLVSYLSSEEPERSRSGKLMTTGAIAILDFDRNNIRAERGAGILVQIARPKEI